MIFENRILPHASLSTKEITLVDFCRYNDIQIEGNSVSDVHPTSGEVCRKLISEYMRYHDFLTYMYTATKRKERYLKYLLTPPYTTSKYDCANVLELLLSLQVVADYSFSTTTHSYFIELNYENCLTIRDVLNIGLCSSLVLHTIDEQLVRYSTKLSICGQEEKADVAVLQNQKLWLINIENAIGLEADIPSHQKQLERIKKRIFRSRKTYCNIEDVVIVTPFVASLLPSSPNIIAIDKYQCLISLLAKEK